MIGEWEHLGTQAISLVPGIGLSILILLTVLFFDPKPHVFMTVIVIVGLGWDAWQNYKARLLPRWQDLVKTQLIMIGYILVMLYVSFFFGFWGVLGILLSGIVIGLIVLWRKREVYMSTVRSIEKMIWGKSFDDDEVKK